MLLISITNKSTSGFMMLLIEAFSTNGGNMLKEENSTKLEEISLKAMWRDAIVLNF